MKNSSQLKKATFIQPGHSLARLPGLLLSVIAACAGCGKQQAAPPPAIPAVPVVVAKAEQKTVPVEIQAIGNVEAYSTVSLKAQVTGQITAIHFREGQDVRKGDLLFEIDRRPFEVALAQAQAVLDGAQVLLAIANSPGRGLTADGRFANATGWQHLTRTYAQLFTCALAFAHRVGYEDGACFWGASEVLGPDGTPLAQAPALEEALLFATIERDAIRRERLANPLLRDERPDLTLRTLKRILREASGEEPR